MFKQLRKYSQAHLTLKRKLVALRKNFKKTKNYSPPENTGVVRFQTTRKTHDNIQNSASSLYLCFLQDPCRGVIEAGGSACKKRKFDWNIKIVFFNDIGVNSCTKGLFCPNWTHFLRHYLAICCTLSKKIRKKRDLTHAVAATLVLN